MEISQNILNQLEQTREAVAQINLDKWTEQIDGVRMDLVNLPTDPIEREKTLARLTPLIAQLKEQNEKITEALLKVSVSALAVSENAMNLFHIARDLDRSLERSQDKLSDFPMEGRVPSVFESHVFKGTAEMIAPFCRLASKVISLALSSKA